MTTLVDRLESEGLVRRVDDPSDRRSRRAQLTPEGESRARIGIEAIERLNAKFDSLMGERDGPQLERLLGKLEAL
jgi:DNA-binding MarR family transcriptional regulator